MRGCKSMCLLLFVLTLSYTTHAQVKRSLNEMNLAGSFNVLEIDGENFTSIRLNLRFGHFTSQRLQIGGLVDFVNLEGSDAFGELGGFVAIHFPSSRRATTVPFISGELGHSFGREDNGVLFGGSAGLKMFVNQGAAITVNGYYQKRTSGGSPANYGAAIGVSIFF